MGSLDEELVDVVILRLGAAPDAAAPEDQVTIKASPGMMMAQLKKELADMFEQPAMMTDSSFVKQMPNGSLVPIHDGQKLGSRRDLLYRGPEFKVPSEPPPPVNLLEFDGFDDGVEILSPRSVRAVGLAGISVDDLYYAPVEYFWEPGLDPVIIQLHHDFFEAVRQDTLAMCLEQREKIIREEGEVAESWEEQSTRDWLDGIQDFWSKNSRASLSDSTTREPSRTSSMASPLPRFPMPRSNEEVIAGPGGTWDGALSSYSYPLTNKFLGGLRHWMETEKVFDRPLKGEPKASHADRFAGSSPGGPRKHLDLSAPGVKARQASEEVSKLVKEIKGLKREKKREQVAGLVLSTNSGAVVQRRKNSMARSKQMKGTKTNVDFMVQVAEYQTEKADEHFQHIEEWRDHREACSQESRGPWKTTCQQKNFDSAYSRTDYWHERRDVVHMVELDNEEKRNEDNIKRAAHENVHTRRVANIRDLARVGYARNWLERRIRWAKGEAAVSKANEEFKMSIMNKHAEAQARVHDRDIRLAKQIEVKREYKALRRTLQSLSEEREKGKRNMRTQAVSDQLRLLGDEAEPAWSKTSDSHLDPNATRRVPKGEDEEQNSTLHDKEGWKQRRPMHLSMSRISSPTSSMHMDLTTPTSKLASPTSRSGSMTMNMTTKQASSPSNVMHNADWVESGRVVKRLPRFDLGRFGSESLSPAAVGTPQARLGMSLSSPNLKSVFASTLK